MKGADKRKLKQANKVGRIQRQLDQPKTTYWSTHRGDNDASYKAPDPQENYRGQMCPSGRALDHPAADLLLEYAMFGCPTRTGKDWTVAEMQSAIDVGPHKSAMKPEAMEHHHREVEEKEKQGFVKVIRWDDIKDDPPPHLKISRFACVPHKSKQFRGLLDLSYTIKLLEGNIEKIIPSVNDTTTKLAPRGAMDQMGHALDRIIYAVAEADENEIIFLAKTDVKNGFWRCVAEKGKEYNFAYVLPQEEGFPVKLVVPTSLQMGWIESPGYFCAASETGRDVGQSYAQTPLGSLPDHKFIEYTQTSDEYKALPDIAPLAHHPLQFMLDVYVDNFLSVVIPRCKKDLDHIANAVMHGMHSVFPPDSDDDEDAIALKKLKKKDAEWATTKDMLGWTFDGINKTMVLDEEKLSHLLSTLKAWTRSKKAIPFVEFRKTVAKVRHACKGVYPQPRHYLVISTR